MRLNHADTAVPRANFRPGRPDLETTISGTACRGEMICFERSRRKYTDHLAHPTQFHDPTIEDSWRRQMLSNGELAWVEIIDTGGEREYLDTGVFLFA